MKKWNIINSKKDLSEEKLLDILLENRGLKTKIQKQKFLSPKLSEVTIESVGIDKRQLKKATERIKRAVSKKKQIIVFGDYDVDGICGTAILWETLNDIGAKVLPYIPSRFEEGYGLSVKGIDNLLKTIPEIDLIITVDNGIVANDAVEYAVKLGIDVIITDHHVPSKKNPNAYSIVHTTLLCGAGVAYLLSKQLKKEKEDNHLELVVLATIADLVPLTYANRIFVYFGLEALRKTKRIGLLSLFRSAVIESGSIDVYEIGHIIAPRLNAMGRLSSAMDSLRLLCTKDRQRADILAKALSDTNFERQRFTTEALIHAKDMAKTKIINNLLFIADESYREGIIGLVAGRLVEEFYLPSIVISKGKVYSKASVRSVKGFNIIEFLREASDLLVDVGGHPMAAGFTVETKNLDLLEQKLYKLAAKLLKKKTLERVLNIDLELPSELINFKTYELVCKFKPFGMANPEPTFVTRNLTVESLRIIGKDGKHLKLGLKPKYSSFWLDAIAFGMGELNSFKIKDVVDVVYTLEENEWNGNKRLQLKVKDIRKL
ncbi:MAG: single-stranded-DNA-specific exonuclease RecJ [Candidatus Levybacteria bacterium]|nr:single-stranded-DNA-specific exonuclease RecJ [Candidatus Levybacteria bacterium]